MNSINELPDNVAAGDTGHPITHEVIHAGLKDHETRIASTEADISAKADLVGGKVPASQIPDIAITDFLGEVASESEMNALSGQKGDWAVRTDTGTQWILIGDNEWKEMVSPSSPVQSVAGKTGAVTLAKTDVGLANVDNTSDANKPVSTAVNTALQGKANSSHTHTIDEVTGLQAGLDGKSGTDHKHAAADITSGTLAIERIPTGTTASTVTVGNDPRLSDTRTPKAHSHQISEVTNLRSELDSKSDTGHTHDWATIEGKPVTFPPGTHTHSISEITNLQTTLDSKSNSNHAHSAADVTSGTFNIARIPVGTASGTVAAGDDSRLTDARTPKAHTHGISDVTDLGQRLDVKADLVDGKVPTSQIPAIALTKPSSVTSRSEMTALDAQEGDIAIISAGADKGSYILGDGPSTSFDSWLLLAVESNAPVQSINGQTGTVVLAPSDIGAAPESHSHTIAQITNLQTTLNQKSNTDHTHSISNITGLQATLDEKSDVGHTHDGADITGALTYQVDAGAANVVMDMTELGGPSDFSGPLAVHLTQGYYATVVLQGLGEDIDSKADKGHTHDAADISGALTDQVDVSNGSVTFVQKNWDGSIGDTVTIPLGEYVEGAFQLSATLNYSLIQAYDLLESKAEIGHTHAVSEVDGLQAALNERPTRAEVESRTPPIVHVSELPANPDPGTLYVVVPS